MRADTPCQALCHGQQRLDVERLSDHGVGHGEVQMLESSVRRHQQNGVIAPQMRINGQPAAHLEAV